MNLAASAFLAVYCGVSERIMFKIPSLGIEASPEPAPESFNRIRPFFPAGFVEKFMINPSRCLSFGNRVGFNMKKRTVCHSIFIAIVLVSLMLAGCMGKIRYSQTAPEAKNFRPERIAVLYVNSDAYPESAGKGEQVIAESLIRKGYYKQVESPEAVKERLEKDPVLKKTIEDYLNKLKMVNFSDPDMSRKIGEAYHVQAFIVAKIDLWNYSVESGKKMAKVGMEMKLISAENGRVMWRGSHNRIEDYMWFKPELTSMGKSLAREMIGNMPH